MRNQQLVENIIRLIENRSSFNSFDFFLIDKMLGKGASQKIQKEDALSIRWDAYHEMMRRVGKNKVAAAQTIQKWFGIHGKVTPDREYIFRLGFALGLEQWEVSEYLRKGIGDTDFVVNDYREVIFMYGLDHHFTYEEALSMIEEFEQGMLVDQTVVHHHYTNDLLRNYCGNRYLGREEFLKWMLQYADKFKGYSMTLLEYFQFYKKEILHEVKLDAGRQLEEFLQQTSFYVWEESRHYSPKRRKKTIPQYLAAMEKKKGENISDRLRKTILELLKMSQIAEDSNTELLAELYTNLNDQYQNRKINSGEVGDQKRIPLDVNLMNNKYLSQVLKVGEHKEQSMRLTAVLAQVRGLQEGMECPEDMAHVLEKLGYSGPYEIGAPLLEWVEKKQKEQARACRMVQRKDLLLLILCIAQKRYIRQLEKVDDYRQEDAQREFASLANLTLSACQMEILNPEKYEFDATLWLCFQPEDMYFLSDIMEAANEITELANNAE